MTYQPIGAVKALRIRAALQAGMSHAAICQRLTTSSAAIAAVRRGGWFGETFINPAADRAPTGSAEMG